MGNLKVLHTSDWHLGNQLLDRPRYEEFKQFLEWMLDTIKKENIDLLIVAGDIFDVLRPAHIIQHLYYNFLAELNRQTKAQAVIVAGNHDSASLIDAPKELLTACRTYAIGSASLNDEIGNEIIIIRNDNGEPAAIVAAVPFLHDGDVSVSIEAESIKDSEARIREGIAEHYRKAAELAKEKLAEFKREGLTEDIPIIATGHLFATGCNKDNDEGEHTLYIGNSGEVSANIFDLSVFNYVALGHLHRAQKVAGNEHIRYSGSPLHMSFGEAKTSQQNSVVIIEFEGNAPTVKTIEVPIWQKLANIKGSREELVQKLNELQASGVSTWVMAEYTGQEQIPSLHKELQEHVKDSLVKILGTKCPPPLASRAMQYEGMNLKDLDPCEIFEKLLNSKNVAEEERQPLRDSFMLLLKEISEEKLQKADGKA